MRRERAVYQEIAHRLRWDRGLVAMFWAYFDESGEHDPETGHLTRLTLGGGMATADNWDRLTEEWDALLRLVGVDMFHMTDFEADQGEFRGWKKDRPYDRIKLLNGLLDLIVREVPALIGFVAFPAEVDGTTKGTYRKVIVDTITLMAREFGGGMVTHLRSYSQSIRNIQLQPLNAILVRLVVATPALPPVRFKSPWE